MEPCLFRHGKTQEIAVAFPVPEASMEPCLFRHGKLLAGDECGAGPEASMEPCLFRHGKAPRPHLRPALDELQWSHVFSDMVSPKGRAQVAPVSLGFNGAMSFQTW